MIHKFSKPDINFPNFPFIMRWIEYDYTNRVNNSKELVEFIHRGLNEIETSNNQTRIEAYKTIVYPLFSINIGKSYESLKIGL